MEPAGEGPGLRPAQPREGRAPSPWLLRWPPSPLETDSRPRAKSEGDAGQVTARSAQWPRRAYVTGRDGPRAQDRAGWAEAERAPHSRDRSRRLQRPPRIFYPETLPLLGPAGRPVTMARRTVTTTPRSAGGQVTAAPAAPRTVPTAVAPLLEPALALLFQAQLMVTIATNSDLVFEQKQVAPAPESCRPNEYWSAGHCCVLCPAGTYVSEPCRSPHSAGVCVKYDTGTFTSFPNGLDSCFLCDLCSSDEEMVVDCTSTSNRVCRCQTGHFYRHKDFFDFCSPCSTCPRGSVALQKCNATADTVCGLPEPLRRHRWFLIGSFPFLLVILVFTFVYAAKPEDGISAGCRCCPDGASDRSEKMLTDKLACSTPCSQIHHAGPPVLTVENRGLSADDLHMVSEAPTFTSTWGSLEDVNGLQAAASEGGQAPEQSPVA
ncbi:uncharacterized protein LOC118907332 isoform X2 [Manis pentadactyla]|uniref:uncharacterized protein LOC118907332 isoform X2 n=1 Tax=Manis pentadactyla TaxID=143292 RepID=UPI00255C3AA5|nr:uncharacterized protein LOC118907332 isoform X2 [Manis pentadactyla]